MKPKSRKRRRKNPADPLTDLAADFFDLLHRRLENTMTMPNNAPYTPPNATSEIPLPLCPHCAAELPVVSNFFWHQGIFLIVCVYCPQCRRTIHMQVLPNPDAIAAAQDSSRIASPD